jgi:hypothetical protein
MYFIARLQTGYGGYPGLQRFATKQSIYSKAQNIYQGANYGENLPFPPLTFALISA